jgi:hypothetical protein
MLRTRRLSRIAGPLAFAFLLACAGSQKAQPEVPATPVPPSDPWAWLPEESAFVGQLVVAPFRGTPLWPVWERARGERLALGSLVDPDKIERTLFGGIQGSGQNPSFVATLTGTFGPGYLDTQAKQQQVAPEPHGLLTFYRSGELAFAQVYPELIVACSSDRVEAVGARAAAGPLAKVREAVLFASLGARVNIESADFALFAEDREGDKKALAQQRARRYGVTFAAEELVRAAVSVDMGANTQLAGVVETTGPAQAEALRNSLDETLAALGGNLFVGLLGLRPLISALSVSSDGKYVALRGSVSQADLDTTLERVAGMLDVVVAQRAPAIVP